jgi:tetratricopeptide (TPR) repeat protein
MKDAYFGIGLYHYYAGIAPAALKVLRFLLFLPGGDRALGLREMLTTREQGVLLRGEADYQLHYIYLWYEHQPQRALELLRGLEARYPANGVFLDRIGRIEREYLKDRRASQASAQRLLDGARSGRLAFAPIHEARARLALADDAIALGDPRQALAIVAPVVDRAMTAPYGAPAAAQLLIGRAHLALGDRPAAIAALERAIASAPSDDPDAVKPRARQALTVARAQAR